MKRARKAPKPGTALAVVDRTSTALERTARVERVRETVQRSKADRTLREYTRAWRYFATWCEREGRRALDPSEEGAAAAVAEYLRDRADGRAPGRKPKRGEGPRRLTRAAVEQDLAAIAFWYGDAGLPSPSRHAGVRRFMQGLRREYASKGAQPSTKAAATDRELVAMLATLPDGPRGVRDRALLVLGWFGALRRSELVALDVADLERDEVGYVVTVRRSKTDQLGAGMRKSLPAYPALLDRCPVRAVAAWLDLAGITEGPVFRAVDRHGHVSRRRMDPGSVALVVRRAAAAAGLSSPQGFAGHSLRRGFITTAALNGCSERSIAKQTGHRSMPVLRGYIERATVHEDNAAAAVVGLVASRPVVVQPTAA